MIPTQTLSFPTVWQLRGPCPRCRRFSALCLVACPQCSHVAVMCAAERVAYPSFAGLGAGGAVDPDITSCVGCLKVRLRDFPPASFEQIRAGGIDPDICVEFSLQRLIVETASHPVATRARWKSRVISFLTILNIMVGIGLVLAGIAIIILWIRSR